MGFIFEICICTLALSLCVDIVAGFTHHWCRYINILFGNYVGANTGNIFGELFMYWSRTTAQFEFLEFTSLGWYSLTGRPNGITDREKLFSN